MTAETAAERTVADLVIDHLTEAGIGDLYCLPGVQNDDFFDVLFDRTDALRPIHARHEQTAAYMALGAAQATGGPSAYCVVPGPGALNTGAALATAYATNARVFGLIGQLPSKLIGKDTGQLHEIPDQSGFLAGLTKHAALATSGHVAGPMIAAAMEALLGGRPRPVALEVPADLWCAPARGRPAAPPPPPAPGADEIEAAARLLSTAARPLVMVGGGARGAGAEVLALAEKLGAPVGHFRMGKGVIPADNPLDAPGPVAHRLWAECDAVVAIGSRLAVAQMQWGVDDDMAIVHADIDPATLGHVREPALGIVADAAAFASALTDALGPAPAARAGWLDRAAAIKAEVAGRMRSVIAPQIAWLDAIRAALPREGLFVEEMTQTGYAARLAFPVYTPHGYIASGYQGTLGGGYPTALGAAHARRDVPVVSINGDGGFLFGAAEMATAVRHSIPLTAIVFTDGAYGNVRRFQAEKYGGNRTIASDLANPDFAAMGQSFGLPATRAETPEALRRAVEAGIASGGPSLIEVPVGDFPSPWEFIMMPRVRG